MKNYSLTTCEELIDKYLNEFYGEIFIIEEGILGLGTIILANAEGKKSILIREYYINSWTSGHEIKLFNKLPKKYQKLIDESLV